MPINFKEIVKLLSLMSCTILASLISYDLNTSNIDIYLSATRWSLLSWMDEKIYPDIERARHIYGGSDYVDNVLRDGLYEGLSKGYPGNYRFNDTNVSYVPYGCWHVATQNGIYINLGSSIFVEDRHELFNRWNLTSDKMFCTSALSRNFSSIVTNHQPEYTRNKYLGSETVVCYGGCGTVRFNATCPPGIDMYKGYHASDLCNCSDSIKDLNCENKTNIAEIIKFNTTVNNNKCIIETIDLTNDEIKAANSRKFNLNIYFLQDLIQHTNNVSAGNGKHILSKLKSLVGAINSNIDLPNILLLNIEHKFEKINHNKLFSLSYNGEIEWQKNYDIKSLLYPMGNSKSYYFLGYNSSPLYQTTSRKIITVNGVYIGIITIMIELHHNKFKSKDELVQWLIEDVRCLKKLGAYLIILMGKIVDYSTSQELMHILHHHVDLIIGIGGYIQFTNGTHYTQREMDRILQLKGNETYSNNNNVAQIIINKLNVHDNTELSIDCYINY